MMDLDSFEILQNVKAKPRQLSDNIIVLYFILVGGASSIGWNATMNSFDYFATKYPDYKITFIFPLAIYSAQLSSIFLITKFSNAISYHVRILCALIMNIFIVFFLSIEAETFKNTFFGMSLIMVLLFFLGFNNNLCYASAAGFTSQIDGKYTAYMLIGLSLFGLIASSLKALVLEIFSSPPADQLGPNLFYFSIVTMILTAALSLHIIFMRSDFYQRRCTDRPERRSLIFNAETSDEDSPSLLLKPKRDFKTLFTVFKEVKFYLFLIFILYIQMDLPFPGVMLKKPISEDIVPKQVKTVSMMMTFTVFLVTGKKIAAHRHLYNKYTVICIIIARVFLVSFFIIQAAVDLPVFNTIWFGYLNIAAFGLTMGFCNVSLFVLGAEQVSGEKKEVSGFLSVFTLNIGAILGGFSSLLLKDIGPPA